MSFLDNLENSLKSLESTGEADAGEMRTRELRDAERAEALAAAPWAEKLKTSPYTSALMKHATLAGHKLRTKVYITWMGPILRLEARDRKLELRPTKNGVVAVFSENNAETRTQPIDLASDAEALAQAWLEVI